MRAIWLPPAWRNTRHRRMSRQHQQRNAGAKSDRRRDRDKGRDFRQRQQQDGRMIHFASIHRRVSIRTGAEVGVSGAIV